MPGGLPVRRDFLVPFLPLFPVAGGLVLQVSKLHVIVSWGVHVYLDHTRVLQMF